jgi:dihydroneopterin aldolase
MVLHASVGVHSFEQRAPQRIRVNVDLAVEDDSAQAMSRAAPATRQVGRDELSRVVDYEAVADQVRAIVAAGHVSLVETLAERLGEACLADPRVHLVRIRVEKLDIFADTASVGVEIERRRPDPRSLIPHPP